MIERRLLIGSGFATAGVMLLPSSALARKPRFIGWFVEAVIVGAVSGYVAGRVAQQSTLDFQVEPHWHRGDLLNAQDDFEAVDYPTERKVIVPAGIYDVRHAEKQTVTMGDGRSVTLTCLIIRNFHVEHYAGVVYL